MKNVVVKLPFCKGEAEVFPYATRKLSREYHAIITKELESYDAFNEHAYVRGEAKANDHMLSLMVQKITIDGRDVPVTPENLEDLHQKDWMALFEKCNEIRVEAINPDKKKSLTKSGNSSLKPKTEE